TGVSAYTRLIGDALRGDQSLFAREDGVMEAWRIVEPLLDAGPPVEVYDRGSWGPKSADRLLDPGTEWITRQPQRRSRRPPATSRGPPGRCRRPGGRRVSGTTPRATRSGRSPRR